MNLEEALAVVERGHLEPLYVLAGSNAYWRVEWLRLARLRFLGPDTDTGLVRLESPDHFSSVELELSSGALFDPRKMVVVEGGRWSKKEESLSRYLDHPVPDTILVLVEEKPSPALEKAVGSHRYVEMAALSPAGFRRFVRSHQQRLKIRWDAAAEEVFVRLTAGNEYLAVQELEKLSLMFDDVIGASDVSEVVAPLGGEDKPWDVTEAILRKDGRAALRLSRQHLEGGMAPLFLFVLMARQFVQIDAARRALAQGLSQSQFQMREGLRDFVAKKLWGAAKRYSDAELRELLDWAYRIDVGMKTGYGEPDVWLSLWTGLWANPKKSPR